MQSKLTEIKQVLRVWATLTFSAFAVAAVLALPIAAATPTWSGVWKIDLVNWPDNSFPTFTLTQRGARVTGRHRLKFLAEGEGGAPCRTRLGGAITGTVRGRKLTGTITFPNAKGALYLTLSPNGREIVGQLNILRGPCKFAWGAFNAERTR